MFAATRAASMMVRTAAIHSRGLFIPPEAPPRRSGSRVDAHRGQPGKLVGAELQAHRRAKLLHLADAGAAGERGGDAWLGEQPGQRDLGMARAGLGDDLV